MKKSNLTKVLLMVLSLALLVGSIVAVGASASESNTVEIKAKNIAYTDNLTLLIAVDASLEDAIAGNVKVSYYWETDGAATLKAAKLLNPYDEDGKLVAGYVYTEGDVNYPVFYTEGVPAKELGRVAKVVAYTGTLADDANFDTYSVAEYLYARLYKDGVVNATEGKDLLRKNTYENLLAYGASAQELLVNYGKADADKVALVTDYTYAYTDVEGVSIDGEKTLISSEAITITPTYSGNDAYTGFLISGDGYDKVVKKGASVKISGVASISLYTDPISEYIYDFEETVDSGLTFYTFTGMSTKVPVTQTSVSTDSSASSYYGTLGKLVVDPVNAANKALSVVVNGGTNNSSTSNGGYISNMRFEASSAVEGGKVHILEYDFYLDHSNKAFADPFEINAYDKDGNVVASLQNYSTQSKYTGFIYFDKASSDSATTNVYHFGNGEARTSEASTIAQFDAKKWYRFRFVWDEANNKVYFDVSFDGGQNWYKAFSGDRVNAAATGEVAYLGMQFNIYGIGYSCLFDNISYEIVDTLPEVGALGNDAVEYPAN